MRHAYSFWFMLHKAKDVKGAWIAHALEFDVVTQGEGVTGDKGALAMLDEAVSLVIKWDAEEHKDPLQRQAPKQYFDLVYRILNEPCKVQKEVLEGEPFVIGNKRISVGLEEELDYRIDHAVFWLPDPEDVEGYLSDLDAIVLGSR